MRYIKQFFFLNLKDYENLKFFLPIGMIVTLLAAALIAATFMITYRKRYMYAICTQLLRHEALSEDSAKTLKELRLANYAALRRALARGGQLTHIVKRANEVKPTYEEAKKRGYKAEPIDFTEARFYISEDELGRAEGISKGSYPAWWKPIVASFFILAVLVLLVIFLPELVELINEWAA